MIYWTFTASGPVTNLAARLAGTAGDGQLLVGPETVRRLGDGHCLERPGLVCLKNLAEVVELCRVLAPAKATHEEARTEVPRLPVAACTNTKQ